MGDGPPYDKPPTSKALHNNYFQVDGSATALSTRYQTKPHDIFSYNCRPYDVHDGRLEGGITTYVHPSGRRDKLRHVEAEFDLLPSTTEAKLYEALAGACSSHFPNTSQHQTHLSKKTLFGRYVLVRRCYPCPRTASSRSAQLAANATVRGVLVTQPPLERGPAVSVRYAPPHNSFDVFALGDVVEHLYQLLRGCHSTSGSATANADVHALLLQTYLHLIGHPHSPTSANSGTDLDGSAASQPDLDNLLAACLALSTAVHAGLRNTGSVATKSAHALRWGKLHTCTLQCVRLDLSRFGRSGVAPGDDHLPPLHQSGLVMCLDHYVGSILHCDKGVAAHESEVANVLPEIPLHPTIGVVVLTEMELTFFVVDSVTGALVQPPTREIFEEGALRTLQNDCDPIFQTAAYKRFVGGFWVGRLSVCPAFWGASRWFFRMDPQPWRMLREIFESGELFSSRTSPSTVYDCAPPPQNESLEGASNPLNIISECRLHQKLVHAQKVRDKEFENQQRDAELFPATHSLFTPHPAATSASLVPPPHHPFHVTLNDLAPTNDVASDNPYKASFGQTKRRREEYIDGVDSGLFPAQRSGRFRAAVEGYIPPTGNQGTLDSGNIHSRDGAMRTPIYSVNEANGDWIVPLIDPRWTALPRSHLLGNRNWNTSPTMMAQEMKYGLFQICSPNL